MKSIARAQVLMDFLKISITLHVRKAYGMFTSCYRLDIFNSEIDIVLYVNSYWTNKNSLLFTQSFQINTLNFYRLQNQNILCSWFFCSCFIHRTHTHTQYNGKSCQLSLSSTSNRHPNIHQTLVRRLNPKNYSMERNDRINATRYE